MGNEALARTSMSEHFGCALTAAQGSRGRHALYALRSMALIQAGTPALALKVRQCASMIKSRMTNIAWRVSGRVRRRGIRQRLRCRARACRARRGS